VLTVNTHEAEAQLSKLLALTAFSLEVKMLITYTAKYTKLEKGYMGQLLEWPEVITEGKTLEDCRFMLRDALKEMVAAYGQLKKEIPPANCLMEQLPVEVEGVGQTA
jgi:predicted RNase H-like HicB family nuclease